jgi:hypothetical protein
MIGRGYPFDRMCSLKKLARMPCHHRSVSHRHNPYDADVPPPSPHGSSLLLAVAPMSNPTPFPSAALPPPNPLAAASSFLQHHLSRLASYLNVPRPELVAAAACMLGPKGASLSLALVPDEVAHTLTDTLVFTVCNSSKAIAGRA